VLTGHVGLGKFDRGVHLVRHFEKQNVLGPDLLFSHCSTLHGDELEAVTTRGVSLSSTPDTELQMGMGHPIAFKVKSKGCCVSIGIDVVSNKPANMFQKMRHLLQAQRQREHDLIDGPPWSTNAKKCWDWLRWAEQQPWA